ncbi:hypothetical protein M426DRAFT_322986 [Hypoxylon sp. CI-4A]|nr:hypothetical protein M426DRAFT_322986 [Hypoxylon sp. CI-4A]
MGSEDDYIFTRDFIDNTRINLMHHVWTKFFGYSIHPSIPTAEANLRVADVGTGTGIWLFDVSDKLKDAQLNGLDISFDAAPPNGILPANVTFHQWSVLDDVPEDLVGVYDIVHVRFLAFVLLGDDIPRVVSKLYSLLKPGGYIQWAEADFETVRFDHSTPESKTDYQSELMGLLEVQDTRLKPTWVRSLPQIFANHGFVDVEQDIKDPPPHLAFLFYEASLLIYELIARKTKNEHLSRELQRLLPGVVKELRQGSYGTSLRCTVIGRKP